MTTENIDIEMCNKPKQIAEDFAGKAMPAKVAYGKLKTLVLAIAAGAFISFGAQASLTAMAGTEVVAFGLAKLLGGIIFSAGLMMIVFTGAELFTGNVLIGISVLEHKTSIQKLFRNWFWVYIGNFIGAIIVASLIHAANA